MHRTIRYALVILFLVAATVCSAAEDSGGVSGEKAQAFIGQDLHLQGRRLVSYQLSTAEHALVFQDGFSMSIGGNRFFSDEAVVWLESVRTEFRGRVSIDYNVRVYLKGNVSVEKAVGARTVDLRQTVLEPGEVMVVRFGVSGEVFVTADEREIADPRGLQLYQEAVSAVDEVVRAEPKFVVQPEALIPEMVEPEKVREEIVKKPLERPPVKKLPKKKVIVVKPKEPGLLERIFAAKKPARPVEVPGLVEEEPEAKEPAFRYPVNIAPAGEVMPKIEAAKVATLDGADVATVIGRFYLWQKRDERGGLLELQADNAVIFYSGQQLQMGEEQLGAQDVLAKGAVKAIYLCGDVVMTEGQRTIRADEMFYDFEARRALAINAVMRNFDSERGIPIYVRAARLRQLAENKFAGENVILTSSEFYRPQISLTASSVIVTDTTTIDEQLGRLSNDSYDAQMRDVRLKMGRQTFFYWPYVRSNLQRPDVPLKSVHAGHDNTWGTSLETRWYLSRLLGLREPEGVDSTLALDYFGKRGMGSGVEIEYMQEDYFGKIIGYIIHDSGEDRLGRHRTRKDLEPDNELRGRFFWRHRQFLPYNWQLTAGVGYASDENFVEGFYRSEFNVGLSQETYLHLKRLQDNWAVSLLGKGRINDFADELEEMPSAEFHLTGQSLFEDKFTLYSDTQISRFRQRIGADHTTAISEERFSFISHRTELDMPIWAKPFKVVPFIAGTFGYDDRSGFTRTLVDGSDSGSFGEDKVWLGEAGVRVGTQYWKVYPNVKSRLWDLNGLRHIIRPELVAALYTENASEVEQRDTLNIAISQRLQTKRGGGTGSADKQEMIDWMQLNTDFTWVNDSGDASSGPDRFIWNRPIVPLRVLSAPDIFGGDLISGLRRFEMYGPRRNYFGADYIWRVSDSSALLSEMNFDMQSGVVQQFDIGLSHMRWPNLQFYIGSRYLRRIEVLDEKGSNAFTFAATYVLDPRYTLVFAQQFDFDYGANIRSDITLLRRYHRVNWAITYSADESLDRQAIVFSIWPQGVPELALGSRRYTGLGSSTGY